MAELHAFGLIAASTANAAKSAAKRKWLNDVDKKHIDDLQVIKKVKYLDTSNQSNQEKWWNIRLQPDPLNRDKKLRPDWYGYWRID